MVLVTTTSNDIRSALKSATKNDDLIIDASATFSYNYLSDISNYIGDYYDLHIKEGNDGVWTNLNYVGVDEVNNLVEVSLKDLTLVNEFINGIGLPEAFNSFEDTGASNLPIAFVTGSLLTIPNNINQVDDAAPHKVICYGRLCIHNIAFPALSRNKIHAIPLYLSLDKSIRIVFDCEVSRNELPLL